jgi:hypothetical protein
LRDGTSTELVSVNKTIYDFKGSGDRNLLDESVKNDLKTTHFRMGSHNNEYVTTT